MPKLFGLQNVCLLALLDRYRVVCGQRSYTPPPDRAGVTW